MARVCQPLNRVQMWCTLAILASGMGVTAVRTVNAAESGSLSHWVQETAGVKGGLGVQIGDDAGFARELASTGRFLLQIVPTSSDSVQRLRDELQAGGSYGVISVDGLPAPARLPYAENLINVLVLDQAQEPRPPVDEILRVLCPRGVLVAETTQYTADALRAAGFADVQPLTAGKSWTVGRKPWPADMDHWAQPRHAADGNAVSQDRQVGPPRRIRWVAGPAQEISSLISAGGRNYYGGLWTRDAFNGLRLWQRVLTPSPAQGGFEYRHVPGSVRPIAVGDELLVGVDSQITALDGRTGQILRAYPAAGKPTEVMQAAGLLLAVDGASVRALELASGRLVWKYDASEPRYVVADDDGVFLLEGAPRKGEKLVATALDLSTGTVRWKKDDAPWLSLIRRTVSHRGLVVFEVSTLNDTKEGNAIHVVSAADGRVLWSRTFVPSMNHMKQARAMFIGNQLWVLEHLKCVALEPQTGAVQATWPAGLCHCFPPVATPRFIFSGEFELTDVATGQLDANRITKAACGRDAGWVPANGLIYTTPKHCVCWPMLRDYTALAPARPGGDSAAAASASEAVLERGVEPPTATAPSAEDWPCYRHDAWRSSSTTTRLPAELKTLWTASLGGWPDAAIAEDWRDDPFIHGPLTAPVVAGGVAYVARSDAHQVVALDAQTGAVRWRFTANGRVDTAPTLHAGLCLFGTKSGWVYCLRADDGRLVWRLRAAPHEERIVAYGQIESPWPVPGSVLVIDGVAYFAAGRQPLADGGIHVFAVEPATGQVRWTKRLDTLPITDFYACCGLEFDNFDLLHQEDDAVAMSRWLFRRSDGTMTCKAADAFAVFKTEGLGVAVPRGCWTYAPRHQPRHGGEKSALRPLVVFRNNTLLGSLDDLRSVYRRDFDFQGGEQFKTTWITGWAAGEHFGKRNGEVYRSDRLTENRKWSLPVFDGSEPEQKIAALAWAGDNVFLAGSQGGLRVHSADDGRLISQTALPAPVWDGMAAAAGRLFVSTRDGQLVCLGNN